MLSYASELYSDAMPSTASMKFLCICILARSRDTAVDLVERENEDRSSCAAHSKSDERRGRALMSLIAADNSGQAGVAPRKRTPHADARHRAALRRSHRTHAPHARQLRPQTAGTRVLVAQAQCAAVSDAWTSISAGRRRRRPRE